MFPTGLNQRQASLAPGLQTYYRPISKTCTYCLASTMQVTYTMCTNVPPHTISDTDTLKLCTGHKTTILLTFSSSPTGWGREKSAAFLDLIFIPFVFICRGFQKCFWTQAVFSTFPLQNHIWCHMSSQRTQPFDNNLQTLPWCAEIYPNSLNPLMILQYIQQMIQSPNWNTAD